MLALTIICRLGFVVIHNISDVTFIDMLAKPGEVLAVVGAMTPSQKLVHILVSASLDMAFPMAYGGLMVGLVHRYFLRATWILSVPALLAIVFDVVENLVQILILQGNFGLLSAKLWLTPAKFGFALIGVAIAITALGVGVLGRNMQRTRR